MKIRKSKKRGTGSLLSPFAFDKHGDALHFRINDYRALEQILDLDEALWIATTAPTSTLKVDEIFLDLLDSDEDQRISASGPRR